jgi:hypothetical protein
VCERRERGRERELIRNYSTTGKRESGFIGNNSITGVRGVAHRERVGGERDR